MMSNISPKFAVVRGSLQATPLQSNVWCMIWHRSCEPCHWLGKLCCDHRLATQSSETFSKVRSWHFLLDYLYYIMFSIAIHDLSDSVLDVRLIHLLPIWNHAIIMQSGVCCSKILGKLKFPCAFWAKEDPGGASTSGSIARTWSHIVTRGQFLVLREIGIILCTDILHLVRGCCELVDGTEKISWQFHAHLFFSHDPWHLPVKMIRQ